MREGELGVFSFTFQGWNGVATSSSPFQGLSRGDEDIAAPKRFPKGAPLAYPSGMATVFFSLHSSAFIET